MSHPTSIRQLALAVAAATAWMACGQTAAQVGDDLEVVVRRVTGKPIRGRLGTLSLEQGASVRTEDEETLHVQTVDLVRITATATRARAASNEFMLELVQGDRLYGRIVGGNDETVELDHAELGRLHVPLEAIARLQGKNASLPSHKESHAWFMRTGRGDTDSLLLTNGDVIRGFIDTVDAEGITIEGPLGKTSIRHRLLVSARFVGTLRQPVSRPHFVVTLRDASVLTVTAFELSEGTARGRLQFGEQIECAASRISRVDVIGGRWEWLTTHDPISYQHTPMLSLSWDYASNRNVLGGPIRVAKERFDHGLGVHSRSSLTYDLKGKYSRFVTSYGIDDDSGPLADVSVVIMVDGISRFQASDIHQGKLHGPVHVDLTNAGRLELLVEYGANGDVQDRFDWVEPALIRK